MTGQDYAASIPTSLSAAAKRPSRSIPRRAWVIIFGETSGMPVWISRVRCKNTEQSTAPVGGQRTNSRLLTNR